MDEKVKKSAVRFIESTGRWADGDIFSEEDAWEFMGELLADARSGLQLNDGQLMALRNLGADLGMRPGLSLSGYIPALTRAFGDTPMDADDVRVLVEYIYVQVNGGGDFQFSRKPRVALSSPLTGVRGPTSAPPQPKPAAPAPARPPAPARAPATAPKKTR